MYFFYAETEFIPSETIRQQSVVIERHAAVQQKPRISIVLKFFLCILILIQNV